MKKKENIIPERLIDEESDIEEKSMSIFYDKLKDQYTVRIPKEFAESLEINPKKHKFMFTLITPSLKSKDTGKKLKGEII